MIAIVAVYKISNLLAACETDICVVLIDHERNLPFLLASQENFYGYFDSTVSLILFNVKKQCIDDQTSSY